jgi:hypothetical protein
MPSKHRRLPLGECGHPTRNRICRPCYLSTLWATIHRCVDCDKVLPRKGSKGATRCRECWMKQHTARDSRPRCIDCGEVASWRSADGKAPPKRCMSCEIKRRGAERKNRLCEIEGCGLPHKARGLCRKHYKAMHQKVRKPWTLRPLLQKLPCAVCGYDRIRSHLHRPDGKRGYENGNVIPLCSRCHDEIHVGVIDCPAPITYTLPDPTELKARKLPR